MKGFIKLHRETWKSEAFLKLSGDAKAVAVDMWYRYVPGNNGNISYADSDGAKCINKSKATGFRVLKELQIADLIEPTVKGSFDTKTGEARATKWRLKFLKK